MSIDFNKVFKEKKPTEHSIPPALVEYFNRSLPQGLKYNVDNNGNFVLTFESESNLGGFKFDPTIEQKKVIGEQYTINDILSYCENSQQPIPLKLDKEGFILVNGTEFPISKLAFNLYKSLKYKFGTLYLYPNKLPKPFSVSLGYENYEINIIVKRVPNNSVSIAAFESNKNDIIYVKYFVDLKNKTISFNMTINISKAKTIKDVVAAMSIYNAFIDGKGTFNNQSFNIQLDTNIIKKIDLKIIKFWEKVLKIEEILDVSFVPQHENIDLELVYLVEQLYQNLINHRPVRDTNIVDSIETEWELTNPNQNIDDIIGKHIVFQFEATENFELFGIELHLHAIAGIFDSVIKEYTLMKDGKQKVVLRDESENKKRYTSIICFKTVEELQTFKNSKFKEIIIELLHEAKPVQEYLRMTD